MRLLHLIEKYHGVRFSSHSFSELAALVIPYISGRRTDESRHAEFFLILTHVDTHHVVLIVKQALGKRLCKLCLTDSGRSQEQEGSDRL